VLAQVISDAGLKQFHCAEAEKFPHVTYFFNGSHERCFEGEEQVKIPSLSVATYDQKPEMSTPLVADRVIEAINSEEYSFILVNFANGDMVGHTAQMDKICEAIEVMDTQAHRVFEVALSKGFRVMLTADHGNCDEVTDPVTGVPNTQHSVYPVPFLLMGETGVRLGIGRGLADVAPTVLDLLGLTKPRKMTGRSLILKHSLEF
jgi:2,3-bisphosphoglycerate-independent phosphoglycerate mutase